ncbi:PH domain-containing protein [Pontibacter sp. BT310]|uniref:PH domain-containing protein n=1 Tax=Pontibacter populi TaxID=890055 RepID=A0ABS6XGS6_9BACT|nr:MULTISPECIES: PH domain-containing protein [Pontibacter]MBJ6119467.1 PH domain-containing protein [Pontibacter sp. BT310]MBR0571895.1 PH domain-containing protein [Microvirga sp. STS03]MBW3366321.1 PH domain-containing protein [Pontibacter populi]
MLSIKDLTSEEQDPKVIEKVLPKVQSFCTSNEEIQYIAVQKNKLGLNFSPDCIALTNKRVIMIRPKSFGLSLDFKDYSWLNVADVHMKEGVFSATITVKTTSGILDCMEDIPKTQARTLYRFAQEMEETKKEERRQRELEDKRAVAGGGIVINTPSSSSASQTTDDPITKLQKMKTLLDSGILSQEEFDAKKAEILATM